MGMIPAKMSRQDIERHFERALPFLVGCLSVLVALLLPLVISTYIQISSKDAQDALRGNVMKALTASNQQIKDRLHKAEIKKSIKGSAGEMGARGLTGQTGRKGEKGEKGQPGPDGPKGDVGPAGSQGDQGTLGPKGDRGTGDGDKGDPGEQGPKGEKGESAP